MKLALAAALLLLVAGCGGSSSKPKTADAPALTQSATCIRLFGADQKGPLAELGQDFTDTATNGAPQLAQETRDSDLRSLKDFEPRAATSVRPDLKTALVQLKKMYATAEGDKFSIDPLKNALLNITSTCGSVLP